MIILLRNTDPVDACVHDVTTNFQLCAARDVELRMNTENDLYVYRLQGSWRLAQDSMSFWLFLNLVLQDNVYVEGGSLT